MVDRYTPELRIKTLQDLAKAKDVASKGLKTKQQLIEALVASNKEPDYTRCRVDSLKDLIGRRGLTLPAEGTTKEILVKLLQKTDANAEFSAPAIWIKLVEDTLQTEDAKARGEHAWAAYTIQRRQDIERDLIACDNANQAARDAGQEVERIHDDCVQHEEYEPQDFDAEEGAFADRPTVWDMLQRWRRTSRKKRLSKQLSFKS